MTECNLFDDIGIVARSAEPLVDHVNQSDVIGTVETGVHQIGSVDVEDDESCRTSWRVGRSAGCRGGGSMQMFHAVIMTRGCNTVVSAGRAA